MPQDTFVGTAKAASRPSLFTWDREKGGGTRPARFCKESARDSLHPAGPLGTCPTPTSDRVIDYFVVGRGLEKDIYATGVVANACVKPHRPAQMQLARPLVPQRVRVQEKAIQIPKEPAFGPIGCHPALRSGRVGRQRPGAWKGNLG